MSSAEEEKQQQQQQQVSGAAAKDPAAESASSRAETSPAPIDPKAERRLLTKLDFTIFPVFFIIYLMAFLDRINISNAAIQGLTEELNLNEGSRFNVVLFVRSSLPSPEVLQYIGWASPVI